MSLLDTASLIVTPNGYKEGKLYSVIPSDGSGDMSVTRATTATRVNSAGLVELVPYNLNTYSENFTTSWGTDGTSTTTNNFTTAPNGTQTAAKTIANSANGYAYKSLPVAVGTYTLSFYVKASAATTISIDFNDTGAGVFGQVFNLTTEWQRVSFTHNVTIGSNLFISYSGLQLGFDYYIWGAQLVEGSVAKDYQKTETRLNIPRLDYSNGTCPSLLVEPQRTNLALQSSSFDNAAWTKVGVTLTGGQLDPQGTNNAFRAQFSGTSYLLQYTATTNGTSSIYAKAYSGTAQIKICDPNGNFATIYNLTNEWQRITTSGSALVGFSMDAFIGGAPTNQDIVIWGAQLEAGSYPTSYIPTTSASVTRNADVISKTGISSLIGQTEGTLFVDLEDFIELDIPCLTIDNGTNDNRIVLYREFGTGYLGLFLAASGTIVTALSTTSASDGKIAIAYTGTTFVMYRNGVQIVSTTSAIPSSMSAVRFNGRATNDFYTTRKIKSFALWKTRLTNTQLATLTTI